MMFPSRCCTNQLVLSVLAGLTLFIASASAQPKQNAADRLALCLDPTTDPPAVQYPASIEWQGHDVDVEAGIEVLIGMVENPETRADDRELALSQLPVVSRHLKGRPCLDVLSARFEKAGELEKLLTLTCFKGSRDPRGIPLCIRTLENERSTKLRLSAASWLAQWNVRRGVVELVNLLESNEILAQPARMPYVRDNALDLFRAKNRLKGWGFPDREEEIRESILSRTDVSDEEKPALYFAEMKAAIKKWFAENEERFPDWKLGDPLPEAPSGEKSETHGKKP